MPEIYAKTLAAREQIDARYKLKQECGVKGVEVLLPPMNGYDAGLENELAYAAGLFDGKVNLEVNSFLGINREFDPLSESCRDDSRRLFEKVLEIRERLCLDGIISFHPFTRLHHEYVNPGHAFNLKRDEEACKRIKEYVEGLNAQGILVENLNPYLSYMIDPADRKEKPMLTYSETGMFPNDFTRYGFGLPMTLDTAHLGIFLNFCSRVQDGYDANLYEHGISIGMDKEAWKLGCLVRMKGFTGAFDYIIDEYMQNNLLDVRNVHLVNAGKTFTKDADLCTALTSVKGLFDMRDVCKAVLKLKPRYIVPEINEEGAEGYIALPNARKIIEMMREAGA